MFKEIFIIISIIIIIISSNFLIQNYLKNSSQEFIDKTAEVSDLLINNEDINYDDIKGKVGELESKWSEVENIWMLILLHSDLDLIDQSINELKSSLELKNKEISYLNAKNLQFLIENISEKNEFNLKNIF